MLPSFLLLLFFLHLQVEHLGAFRIVHSVEAPDGTKSETVFRFHHKSKLQAQAAVTVGGVCVGVFLVLWYAHSDTFSFNTIEIELVLIFITAQTITPSATRDVPHSSVFIFSVCRSGRQRLWELCITLLLTLYGRA